MRGHESALFSFRVEPSVYLTESICSDIVSKDNHLNIQPGGKTVTKEYDLYSLAREYLLSLENQPEAILREAKEAYEQAPDYLRGMRQISPIVSRERIRLEATPNWIQVELPQLNDVEVLLWLLDLEDFGPETERKIQERILAIIKTTDEWDEKILRWAISCNLPKFLYPYVMELATRLTSE